jgi:hypothetical protein
MITIERRRLGPLAIPLLGIAVLLTGCTEAPTADTPRIEDKTYSFKPAKLAVRIGVLDGQMTEMSVVQRVNADTGEVVYAPHLRGTLAVKNTSSDEAVRLLGGKIEYLDASGERIDLASERADTSFRLSSYSSERLDPGGETRHQIDVPFPASAVTGGKTLSEIRLSLNYLPTPYRQDAVEIPVTLAAR